FDVVAYTLQRITGMDYPSWVDQKLGRPLSMKTLRYGSSRALKEPNVAIGTENGIHNCEFAASEDYGCGDVWIGNADLAKVLTLMLNKGSYGGTEVLREDLYHEMIRPHFVDDDGFNYGLGVDIYGGFRPRILGHGGGSQGYASTFYWIPESDFGVSVQTNMESYSSEKISPHAFGRDARELLLKANGATLIRPQPEEFLQAKTKTPHVDDLSRLAGFYAGLWNSSVFVRYRDGKLFWDIGHQSELTPKGNGFLLRSGNAVRFNFKSKTAKHPFSLTYVNPRWPAARLRLFRVQPVEANPNAQLIPPTLAERITGLYKATYYGVEVTFNVAKVADGQLYVQTISGMTPAYPHGSIDGLFFTPKGEAVSFETDELWVENCRGVKWENPVEELRMLMEKNPKHRLLYKWPLDQIAAHLKELGRKKEAKAVRAIKRELHSKKK
ncbi:MAG: beta-lactamase family protein, partial [Candidatus Bathyarchaeota archaeon]